VRPEAGPAHESTAGNRSSSNLRGVFAEDDAARMRQRVWAGLARFGVVDDDPSTWAAATAASGAMVGLSKAIRR
jgi:hypothetical protein